MILKALLKTLVKNLVKNLADNPKQPFSRGMGVI